jgi:hypothetical protein
VPWARGPFVRPNGNAVYVGWISNSACRSGTARETTVPERGARQRPQRPGTHPSAHFPSLPARTIRGRILEVGMDGKELRRLVPSMTRETSSRGGNQRCRCQPANGAIYATVVGSLRRPYRRPPPVHRESLVPGARARRKDASRRWDLNYERTASGNYPRTRRPCNDDETVGQLAKHPEVSRSTPMVSLSHRFEFRAAQRTDEEPVRFLRGYGPDSMKIDAKGTLYVASNGSVARS